ncbi:MAG: MBL fold metallo-hydrolase [Proteobacteria bacterium]|nr:MBL fold metallo-hydrolase [Pseudomonadota bacterium]
MAAETSVKKFGPVHFIPGAGRGKYPHSNAVYVEGAGILIDTGPGREACTALRDGPGVREVWLSHWHEDHIACLDLFEGLPLRQMEIEAEALAGVEHFLDWYGIESEPFRDYWRKTLVEDFHYRPRRASGFFTAGEVIDLGGCSVEIIHTPGHTPGSTSFYFREQQVLFMADYDLTRFGPWYGDRDSSIESTIASLERLRRIPARVWLTSHEDGCFQGDPTEMATLFDNYLGVIDQREGKLLEYLKGAPRTMADIVGQCIVYRKPREPKAFFEWGEQALMGKHLGRLTRQGKVVCENQYYHLIG